MEYLDDEALNIYTDGSSLPRPRRGGIGIVFVSVDDDGNEQLDDYPMPGYPGGTNQEMELQAPIQALAALVRGQAPVGPSRFRKIVIWTDSQYLTENIHAALYIWPSNDWMTRNGTPVVNARLWQELTRLIYRTYRRVDFNWVKGHKHSRYNKRADKLAKQSARSCGSAQVSTSTVRRKLAIARLRQAACRCWASA